MWQSGSGYTDYLYELNNQLWEICEKNCPKACDSTQFKLKLENSEENFFLF